MRTFALALLLSLGLFCYAANLSARIVTLTVGDAKTNAFLTIATNESLTILSGRWGGTSSAVMVEKDGLKTDFTLYDINTQALSPTRLTIAGPAIVSLTQFVSNPGQLTFLTLEILPDLFAPDKTLVVPQGSGANIMLESSTNLVNWSSVPPGAYTNSTANLFFRIRAERLP